MNMIARSKLFARSRLLRIKTALLSLLGGLLDDIIPVHGKRLLFIVTLYHYLLNDRENHTELLEKLNEEMKLAKTGTASLVFPGLFTRLFWEGDGRVYLDSDPDEIIDELLRKVPCWLMYARSMEMLQDVTRVQEFVKQHPIEVSASAQH